MLMIISTNNWRQFTKCDQHIGPHLSTEPTFVRHFIETYCVALLLRFYSLARCVSGWEVKHPIGGVGQAPGTFSFVDTHKLHGKGRDLQRHWMSGDHGLLAVKSFDRSSLRNSVLRLLPNASPNPIILYHLSVRRCSGIWKLCSN